jgi:regulator of sirC expression with transglutaminase-like and TPR domain
MTQRHHLLSALKDVGKSEDADIDLAETALLLAAMSRSDVDLAPYREFLVTLAEKAKDEINSGDTVERQSLALKALLHGEFGFTGDTDDYDDMANASLIDVIDRRKGLPVALGILYIHAARAAGTRIEGVNFPSHFMIRISGRGQRLIIDPFHDGNSIAPEQMRERLKQLHGEEAELQAEHYRGVSNRGILIRLQNNIKLRSIAAGDATRAVAVLEAMILIAPDRPEMWWETAVLLSRLGNVKRAIATLEQGLARGSSEIAQDQLQDLLTKLRSQMN